MFHAVNSKIKQGHLSSKLVLGERAEVGLSVEQLQILVDEGRCRPGPEKAKFFHMLSRLLTRAYPLVAAFGQKPYDVRSILNDQSDMLGFIKSCYDATYSDLYG